MSRNIDLDDTADIKMIKSIVNTGVLCKKIINQTILIIPKHSLKLKKIRHIPIYRLVAKKLLLKNNTT